MKGNRVSEMFIWVFNQGIDYFVEGVKIKGYGWVVFEGIERILLLKYCNYVP